MNKTKKPNLPNLDELLVLINLDKTMRSEGFVWETPQQIVQAAQDELEEVREALDHNHSHEHLEEELGDLFHTLVSLVLHTHSDFERIFAFHNKKIIMRYNLLKKIAQERGFSTLHKLPHKTLIDLWKTAKCQSSL